MKLLAKCNNCDNRDCTVHKKLISVFTSDCPGRKSPKKGFMLAELALAHPQSLNDSLSALPFKTNLDFYLK